MRAVPFYCLFTFDAKRWLYLIFREKQLGKEAVNLKMLGWRELEEGKRGAMSLDSKKVDWLRNGVCRHLQGLGLQRKGDP